MKKFEVTILQSALDDLEEIILFIAQDNRLKAIEMHKLIIEKMYDLSTFPKRGRLIPDKKLANWGFRMLVVEKYIIFYKIDGNIVHIHRVFHGMRNYPALLNIAKD